MPPTVGQVGEQNCQTPVPDLHGVVGKPMINSGYINKYSAKPTPVKLKGKLKFVGRWNSPVGHYAQELLGAPQVRLRPA